MLWFLENLNPYLSHFPYLFIPVLLPSPFSFFLFIFYFYFAFGGFVVTKLFLSSFLFIFSFTSHSDVSSSSLFCIGKAWPELEGLAARELGRENWREEKGKLLKDPYRNKLYKWQLKELLGKINIQLWSSKLSIGKIKGHFQ